MSQTEKMVVGNAGQSGRMKVIIDTDIGDDIDDALALAVALHSPELDIKGITTVFGDTRLRARLAAHLLTIFGRRDILVAMGMGMPLLARHPASGVNQAIVLPQEIDESMVGTEHATDMITRMVTEQRGEITLVCIGPLTNIGKVLSERPEIAASIRGIVMMGGTGSVPLADWNVRSDARAAQVVLHAGVPITMVGLDVTWRCRLRAEDVRRIERFDDAERHLLFQFIEAWRQHQRLKRRSLLPYLHDPLTMVALCQPSLLRWRDVTLEVLTRGILQGVTVPHMPGGAQVRVATDVRVSEARDWIMDRLLKGDRRNGE